MSERRWKSRLRVAFGAFLGRCRWRGVRSTLLIAILTHARCLIQLEIFFAVSSGEFDLACQSLKQDQRFSLASATDSASFIRLCPLRLFRSFRGVDAVAIITACSQHQSTVRHSSSTDQAESKATARSLLHESSLCPSPNHGTHTKLSRITQTLMIRPHRLRISVLQSCSVPCLTDLIVRQSLEPQESVASSVPLGVSSKGFETVLQHALMCIQRY